MAVCLLQGPGLLSQALRSGSIFGRGPQFGRAVSLSNLLDVGIEDVEQMMEHDKVGWGGAGGKCCKARWGWGCRGETCTQQETSPQNDSQTLDLQTLDPQTLDPQTLRDTRPKPNKLGNPTDLETQAGIPWLDLGAGCSITYAAGP